MFCMVVMTQLLWHFGKNVFEAPSAVVLPVCDEVLGGMPALSLPREEACVFYPSPSGRSTFIIYSVFANVGNPAAPLSELQELIILNWRDYATRYDLAIVLVRDNLARMIDEKSSPHWSKVILLNILLEQPNVEWLFYLDYDAIFVDFSKSPQEYIFPMLDENTAFLIANHCDGKSPAYQKNCEIDYKQNKTAIKSAALLSRATLNLNSCSPNSGVFLTKNNDAGKEISQTWLKSYELSKNGLFFAENGGILNDQGGFNLAVTPKYINMTLKIVPRDDINGFDGRYIRHFLGRSANDKKVKILEALDNLKAVEEGKKEIESRMLE